MSNNSFFSYIPFATYFFGDTRPQKRKKYNMVTKAGMQYLANIKGFTPENANIHSLAIDEDINFSEIDLTDDEALELKGVLNSDDTIEEEVTIKLPPITYLPIEDIAPKATVASIAAISEIPTIITEIPKYEGPAITNQDVIIMDSLIFPDSQLLEGFQVKTLKNFVSKDPCLPHGTNVAEVIAQEFDPKQTDMIFLNVAVFDCDGTTNLARIAGAIDAIIKYKKGEGKDRGLTVNFSGAGNHSEVLNKLFKQLVKHDINVVVAAGNESQNCKGVSPASASINSSIQSIGATEAQTLARYSNFATDEPCINLYVPGCLPMTNPNTKQKVKGCGTSFAAPLQTGRTLALKAYHPKMKPDHVKKTMAKNSVTIPGPNDIKIRSITKPMAFSFETLQNKNHGKQKAHHKKKHKPKNKNANAPDAKTKTTASR